jgi:hypothetical protein
MRTIRELIRITNKPLYTKRRIKLKEKSRTAVVLQSRRALIRNIDSLSLSLLKMCVVQHPALDIRRKRVESTLNIDIALS